MRTIKNMVLGMVYRKKVNEFLKTNKQESKSITKEEFFDKGYSFYDLHKQGITAIKLNNTMEEC